MKPRTCETCQTIFTPQRMGARACSPMCAINLVKVEKKAKERAKKEERKADVAKLAKLSPIRKLLKDAQTAFNRMTRARDLGKPCCACGLPVDGGGHASHYLSVGSHPNLRFDESNCHVCCVRCNVFLHGNLIPYRVNLIERVGLDEVLRLESSNGTRKYTREEIEAMTVDFRERAKALERSAR